jgi:RNA polymerase sigma factor (sigma-70 family)
MIHSIFSLNLTKPQWIQIRKLLQHPKTTIPMREKIHNILFHKYRTWTIHQAYEFKRYHRYKCRNINIEDIISYSLEGLQIAIRRYNGSSYFHTYANKYILWQLYKGLTDLQPITILSKSIRRRAYTENKNRHQYKKLLNTQFIGFDHYWIFEKRQSQKQVSLENERIIEEWWETIELDSFSKRTFKYKYDFSFNKIRSNREISELMCCSEETIRMNLKKTREILRKIYPNILLS